MEFHAKELYVTYKVFRVDMRQAVATSSKSSGTEGCCTERAELGGAASRLCAAFWAQYDASVWRSAAQAPTQSGAAAPASSRHCTGHQAAARQVEVPNGLRA